MIGTVLTDIDGSSMRIPACEIWKWVLLKGLKLIQQLQGLRCSHKEASAYCQKLWMWCAHAGQLLA